MDTLSCDGFYMQSGSLNYIYINARVEDERLDEVLYHELFHHFIP